MKLQLHVKKNLTILLSSNGRNSAIMFKISLSRFINKVFLRSNLSLLEFEAKIPHHQILWHSYTVIDQDLF